MKIIENYNLKNHNTFGFDVVAKKFVEYDTETELIEFLSENAPIANLLHIGSGSNLLFLGDFGGTVLHSKINFIEEIAGQARNDGRGQVSNENFVDMRVGAGVVWDSFVEKMVELGLGGAENLSLIPSEIGAAAVQNIGAYGVEIQDIIQKVEAIETATLQKKIFDVAECKYGYRDSIFKNELKGKFIVTSAVFRLWKKPQLKLGYGALKEQLKDIQSPDIQDVRNAVIAIRQSKLPDPKTLGNAGSFFKNPFCCKEHFEYLQKKYPKMPFYPVDEQVVKLSAAWLIEQCGLKGRTLGGAAVYHLQPLVLVNSGNASPQDVATLAAEVQKTVKEKFCVDLECEVNFVG